MDLLDNLKDMMATATDFKYCKNFYFENHLCTKTNEFVKINLDFKLSIETDDKVMKFGICKHCNTLFYHNDFEAKSF